MSSAPALLAWTGTARTGRVELRAPDGGAQAFAALPALAEHLRGRGDPWGGTVRAAAALGVALHGFQRLDEGVADLYAACDEAHALLHDLPVDAVFARLRACIQAHRDLLGWRECAARLVLEAKRLQRELVEGAARAAAAGRERIPATGTLLLAWPGGPACDLGDGLLTGALIGGRRTGGVLVAGPAPLAGDAVAHLAAQGLAAQALDPAAAAETCRSRPLAGVLVRCQGRPAAAEPAAAALVQAAAARGVPVFALGLGGDAAAPGLVPLAAARLHTFLGTP